MSGWIKSQSLGRKRLSLATSYKPQATGCKATGYKPQAISLLNVVLFEFVVVVIVGENCNTVNSELLEVLWLRFL